MPRLQHLFNLLEADRIQLCGTLQNISEEKLNNTADGRWSVLQIISHLLTAEKLSLQYMKKKALGIKEAKNSGFREDVKMTLLWLSQRLPFKFKAPRVVVELTPSYSSFSDVMKEWTDERERLRHFLEEIKDDQQKKMIYKHVRAGMLNVRQALAFTREHYLHHLPQIHRQLK